VESLLQNQVWRIQSDLYRTITHNRDKIRQLEGDIIRQRVWIEELNISNAAYRQELNRECTINVETRLAYKKERRKYSDMVAILTLERESHLDTERILEIEKKQCQDMAIELDRMQKHFHLLDSLVDTMLLQEDSHLDVSCKYQSLYFSQACAMETAL
jgi:hypothetical protein